jgi:hypothetical protein
MHSYLTVKEQAFAETPLLLFDCLLADGSTERWSTHAVIVDGESYRARILQHNVFELQAATEQGVDGIPKITFELANADSRFSEIERQTGWKGAKLTVRFLFFDLKNAQVSSDSATLFKGIVNSPDLITEGKFRLSAVNRLALQRLVLPPVRIQRRCPWTFPSTAAQRQEAIAGGTEGNYSRFYRCGYSADLSGGVGNLHGIQPYTGCSYTRADCTARGMFSTDNSGRPTARFGGEEYVPSSILVRSAGESGSHISPLTNNDSRYNDFVPLVYGTAFLQPSIVFARNDGNLTRMELILGMGPIQGVLKVVVNGVEIPQGILGQNMTGTGWFNIVSKGDRQGAFNADFTDGAGHPLGDPYGSISFLSVVIPNRINDGRSTPSVQVLMQGLLLPVFDLLGAPQASQFCNNPAWVILDLLRRSGWNLAEFDIPSFFAAAAFCGELIPAQDLNGNSIQLPRFSCNLVLKTRRSAGDVIRGIRNASRLFLTFGPNGSLQLKPENSIAKQQPAIPAGSNTTSTINGGFAAYEFGDGTGGFGGILRNPDGSSSVKLSSRSAADAPNRFIVEFQDSMNDYQQDSYAVVNVDDVTSMNQEITQAVNALGISTYDQAARILQVFLSKSLAGNTQIEFDTSVKGVGLSPGDLITVSYRREGLVRQIFRVQKVSLNTNFRSCRITAQWHDDAWYSDSIAQILAELSTRRHGGFALSAPRPIGGSAVTPEGQASFDVKETYSQTRDGTSQLVANVSFELPSPVLPDAPGIPLVSLSPRIDSQAGSLVGPVLYYAVTCSSTNGAESALSFSVAAGPLMGAKSAVTLQNLSFPSSAATFSVYRGANPAELFQVASGVRLATTFVDTGLPARLVLPPDPNFDHVAFYWRMELQPETNVTIFTNSSVGNSILAMPPNRYAGKLVRITRGTGAGQERLITANTDTTLICAGTWIMTPDSTSVFTVSESSFVLGSKAKYSPVRFAIPNEAGAVVQISGRSVNANDVECAYELCPLTRWTVGGAGPLALDRGTPPSPLFALDAPKTPGGSLLLSGLAFPYLENTTTITAATLTLFYVDETVTPPLIQLSAQASNGDSVLAVQPSVIHLSPFIQAGQEVMGVTQVLTDGTIQVTRGVLGTSSTALPVGTSILELQSKSVIIPLLRGFFGSPASGNWSYPLAMPNARIVCATLTVTNSQGTSEPSLLSFSTQSGGGIRTLSGGQYSFQIAGYLAIQTGAAPEIIVDSPRVIRDISAVLGGVSVGAPVTLDLIRNGGVFCKLTIPDGTSTPTSAVDGLTLPPLKEGDRIGISITAVGSSLPGNDLTVVIRV